MNFWTVFFVVYPLKNQGPVYRILKKYKSDFQKMEELQKISEDLTLLMDMYTGQNVGVMYFECTEEPPEVVINE